MSTASKKTNHVQWPSTHLVGLTAALHTVVGIAAGTGTTTTACDGPWGGCNEGRKGHN